jgi:hypothetical protein
VRNSSAGSTSWGSLFEPQYRSYKDLEIEHFRLLSGQRIPLGANSGFVSTAQSASPARDSGTVVLTAASKLGVVTRS